MNWIDHANCKGSDTNYWFPSRHTEYSPAYLICAGCTVRKPCLEDDLNTAIVEETGLGIRAGLIPFALTHLRRLAKQKPSELETLITVASRHDQTLEQIAKLVGAGQLRQDDYLVDYTGTFYKVFDISWGDDTINLTLIRPDAYKTERRWTIPVRPSTAFWRYNGKPILPKRPKRRR